VGPGAFGRPIRSGLGKALERVLGMLGAIGVGGLLCAHHARGDQIGVVTLTRGARGGAMETRHSESQSAAELIDARLFLEDLTDTMVPVSDPTVGIIQHAIEQVQPDTVYTHSVNDVHQDHRAVSQATMVAARGVPTVACYQSPSSAVGFRPNRFAAIDDYLAGKLELIRCFSSQAETRDYLESDLIVATARYWSRFGTGRYAQAREEVRARTTVAGPPLAPQRPEDTYLQ
jgi:LmbE family N-acetylglucosaminyl deacetylase